MSSNENKMPPNRTKAVVDLKSDRTRVNVAVDKNRLTIEKRTNQLMANGRPRLLVSVRSADEAKRAISGGAEILDVKEPSRGSLGMATVDQIGQIARFVAAESTITPLSVALGESIEWSSGTELPELPVGIQFAKLGLSGCGLNSHWSKDWIRVREEFECRSASPFSWVAVGYVDAREARSPGIDDVISAAIDSGCRGVLLDTFSKDEKHLLSWIGVESLRAIADRCHHAGLFLALAGKLSLSQLPLLSAIATDVVAVRSAACNHADRTSEICSTRIAEFLNSMQQNFKTRPVHRLPFSFS